MSRFTQSLSLFFLAFSMLVIASCQKQTLNRIEGTWTLIPIQFPNTNNIEEWVFEKGDFKIVINGNDADPFEKGTYSVNATFLETTLDLQPTKDKTFIKHYSGEWIVYEVTSTHMTLLHFIEEDHGLSMREFER